MPEHNDEEEHVDIMADPRYLRQSSQLVSDALQKGFDVLQLANGDIITTGTKTVVYTYTWDEEKGKLARVPASRNNSQKKKTAEVDSEAAGSLPV